MLVVMSIAATDHEYGAPRGPSIARANADFSRQRKVWLVGRREAMERRRVLHAVDGFLDTVEESNLAGHGRALDPLMRHRLRRFEAQVGRPLPPNVWQAPTGHRLHEALLDWQETLLDQAGLGPRLLFGNRDEDFAS
jgi:hypothetical protein